MNILTLSSSMITTMLMLSTMICGLWIRANGITDPGSYAFHIWCGIAAVIFSLITLMSLIIMLARMKRKG